MAELVRRDLYFTVVIKGLGLCLPELSKYIGFPYIGFFYVIFTFQRKATSEKQPKKKTIMISSCDSGPRWRLRTNNHNF